MNKEQILRRALEMACKFIYEEKQGGCRVCPCTNISFPEGYESRVCWGPDCAKEIEKVFISKVKCEMLFRKATAESKGKGR